MSWNPQERPRLITRVQQALEQLLRPAEFGATSDLDLTVFHVPGEPITAAEARAGDYVDFKVGDTWGARWGTAWFWMSGEVPADWAGEEVVARIELGNGGTTGFGCEGMVWDGDTPLQGISPNHTWFRISDKATAGPVKLHVEAAANPPCDGTMMLADPEGDHISALLKAQLAVRHRDVFDACMDVEVLLGLLKSGREDEPRTQAIHRALTQFCAALDPDDVRGSLPEARVFLTEALAKPAAATSHTVVAAGHAHIDTAWLWPVRETVRKCARSFSTAVTLMDEYPDYRFVCSQAQHHAWMKERYPELFERMRKKVANGQFEPVGSMWVEPDVNIPSGESLVRQIVLAKRFFLEEYGVETRDIWLPDVFGYSPSLPQIMKEAGIDWFLTQKISWSDTNKFPHHTFWWEGIDGTRIFSHFPPADTYNSTGSSEHLTYTSRNFKDHGNAEASLYPFGWGDGGGGPTREHLERLERAKDTEGLPRVEFGGVESFFEKATQQTDNLPVWTGELYLEYHRGTYTTHGAVKKGNRDGELVLREAELWSSYLQDWAQWPADELDEQWKVLLVNQFHDIIPGSSIHMVYDVTAVEYAEIQRVGQGLVDKAVAAIAGAVDPGTAAEPAVALNVLSHDRTEVVETPAGLRVVTVPPTGHAVIDLASPAPTGGVTVGDGVVENEHLRLTWDTDGLLTSVFDKDAGREVLAPGQRGNVLQLMVDRPNNFDAWDVERYVFDAPEDITALDSVEVVSSDPLRAEIRFVRSFGKSTVTQTMVVSSGSRRVDFRTHVDWHEKRKMLKVAFPVDVYATKASYEVQFGHVERPTHTNTSWDWARFEVVAQKWADLSEPDYGVALLNDCKHGYDVRENVLRLSLLRSPTFPDPEADQGEHEFTYSLLPHLGDLREGNVVAEAHALGAPIRVVPVPATTTRALPAVSSLVEVDVPNVVVESVKKAYDSDELVVRLYEAFGQRAKATVKVPGLTAAVRTDLLERGDDVLAVEGDAVTLQLKPFQLTTLRLTL